MGEHSNDITQELALLHTLSGADFSRQVEKIAHRGEFHLIDGETDIYSVGGEQSDDYQNLLFAARKASITEENELRNHSSFKEI